MGPRRGARLRVAPHRGHPHPPHRPGHRARHLLPPPPRPPRREDRPQVRADPEPLGRAGALRGPQQPAFGDRVPGLRVRLLGRFAREPDPLGGAVRRLRQLRPGDHRPVPRRGRVEVGPDRPASRCSSPTATRARGRSTRARASSASSSSPPRATSGSPTRRPRRSTSTSSAARPDREAAAAHRLHAQGAAAPAGRLVEARGPDQRGLPVRARRPARRRAASEEIERLVLCSGKVYYDIDGHDKREKATKVADRPSRAPLPVRARADPRADRRVSEPQADRLGPGGAEEHGRLEA